MIVGLLIILVFPFIYFYIQMNNFNQKTDAIRTAINEKKETYIDPLTSKMHWTENGEQVIWTEILPVERNIPEGCIVGDKVLRGVKTGRVYKNKSYERYKEHIQWQLDHGECWCFERHAYNKKNQTDYDLRYHMIGKYFYSLQFDWNIHEYCIIYKDTQKKEIINYDEYEKLGGCDWKDRTRGYK